MDERWSLLGDAQRENLEARAVIQKYRRSDLIYVQGEAPSEYLYRIEEGEVELRLSLGTEELVLTSKGAGEWIGWFGLFPDKPSPFSAVSATKVTLRAYPQKFVREAMEENAPFASAVAMAMSENIHLIHRELAAEHRVAAIERVETFPFRKRVTEVMKTPVVTCVESDFVNDVTKVMLDKKVTSVVVVDNRKEVRGVLTEKDIVSAFTSHDRAGEAPVGEVMTTPPKSIEPEAYLYQAMGQMIRENIRHLPVVADKKPLGMITMRDLMLLRSHGTLSLITRIEEERDPDELGRIRDAAIPIYRSMLEENVPALEIAALISHVNSEIHRQALRLTLDEMGKPPIDFCLFLTGSHGRGENHLVTDQDHGMILAPYGPKHHDEMEAYFVPFSIAFSDKLAKAGLPYCDGEVMCRNPVWRKPISEWETHLRLLSHNSGKISVRYLTLLADLSPLTGTEAFAHELRRDFIETLSVNRDAALGLYEEASEHKAPLSFFNRIITDKEKGREGEIDIKKSGIIFIVEALRILAIINKVDRPGTIDRLNALTEAKVINKEDAEFIAGSYETLYRFLLRSQLRSIANGVQPDTFMKVNALSERDREALKRAFQSIKRLQSILHSSFGNIFY